MQFDQPIHHTIQNEERAQMPEAGHSKSKQREIGRNGQQSLYIIQKRKLINKKVLKARIKKQAISKRITNNAKPASFDNNEEIVPQKTNYPSQSQTNQNFVSFIINHAENVTCPICLTELIQPIATKCAHLFCLQCIEKSLMTGNTCPLCRQTISDDDNFWLNFDKQAQKLVRLCNWYSSNEEKQAHLKSYLEWKAKRFLTQQQIKPEQPIDVWVPQGSWSSGEIKQIYYNQENKVESVLVQIRKNTGIVKEIIQLGSLRLAKLCFYKKLVATRGRPPGSTSLQHLLDRTRNLFTNQVFELRSRIFFGELRPNLEQRPQREVEENRAMPYIQRLESEVLSGAYLFSDSDRNEDSVQLGNLQPVAVVENPQSQAQNLGRLNPQQNDSLQQQQNSEQFDGNPSD